MELDCAKQSCFDLTVGESSSYHCGKECLLKSVPCNGTCYRMFEDQAKTYLKCPNHEKCVLGRNMCNRFNYGDH